ncbi:type I restriction enzyme HsdR N-terminal domain-containing protein [Prolixibacteraceae bacterium Z1-6]|uniref:Type I restriction enzyme HsdR N-terminal domain-containing protein n=1 Tax=Draconibacterium aestuarii TaxID=2998507 RepID=A0A9X3J3Q4_9BACT|nr:type I restriction enzyme HsdR N-terminal domain-containing protein [Prolixibacteraceae bacterium Z1-6]
MERLNLPEYAFRTKTEGGKQLIFDSIRKKFVVLTPEEWVRQNFIQYLIQEKKYPENLMAVEKQIRVNGKQRRFDLLIYLKNGQPLLIAEFKAPNVKITQDTFDQVVRYNMALRVERVVVSNGLQHFACEVDYPNNSYTYLHGIPGYCERCRIDFEGQGFS